MKFTEAQRASRGWHSRGYFPGARASRPHRKGERVAARKRESYEIHGSQ
ncbi:MAG: hypothetical protein GY801_17630 [bacterium]|nr:hypothetical protein [bacterium]